MRGHYLEGQTQTAIAARQGISGERVRQNISKALAALQREKKLQELTRELWGAKAYHSTGATAYRTRQGSNPELLLEWIERRQLWELEQAQKQDWLERELAKMRAEMIAEAWSGEVRHRKGSHVRYAPLHFWPSPL